MPPMKPARPLRKPRSPRKRIWPRGVRTTLRLGPPILLGIAALCGGVWLAFSGAGAELAGGVRQEALSLSAKAGLRVETILISGNARASRRALESAAQVRRGMAILSFDPHLAKDRLEMLAWVRQAAVERRLPDTVIIRIQEREPLALWQHDGQMALIGTGGVVITRWKLERFWKLPLVVGAGAPEKAFAMLHALKDHPGIGRRVKALVRVSERRWDLRFKNGVVAHLPEKDAARALATLDRLERREKLLDRDILAIDLRLKDRLVVRVKSRPKSERKPGKKKSGARGETAEAARGKDT